MKKYCSKCKTCISIKKFYGNKTKPDGLSNWCKEHTKEAARNLNRRKGAIPKEILNTTIIQKMVGKRYGALVVEKLSFAGKRNGDIKSHRYWLCKCDCGKNAVVSTSMLNIGDQTSCGCHYGLKGSNNPHFKGYGEIGASMWNSILTHGSRVAKDIQVKMSIKDAWELFLKQGGLCALTGEPLSFKRSRTGNVSPTASLDRINSNGHYEWGNVQWIHKDINKMKQLFPQDYFVELCKKVTVHEKRNKSKLRQH